MYGCVRKDIFLMSGVGLGVLANAYGSFTAIELLAKEKQFKTLHNMEVILMGGIIMWIIIIHFITFVAEKLSSQNLLLTEHVLGGLCSFLSIAYYLSPLSKIGEIIRARNVASLYMPMLVMNLVTSLLWGGYGIFGANDPYIILCNGFACFATLIMIALKLLLVEEKLVEEKLGFEIGSSINQGMTPQKGFTRGTSNNDLESNEVYSPIFIEDSSVGLRKRVPSIAEYIDKAPLVSRSSFERNSSSNVNLVYNPLTHSEKSEINENTFQLIPEATISTVTDQNISDVRGVSPKTSMTFNKIINLDENFEEGRHRGSSISQFASKLINRGKPSQEFSRLPDDDYDVASLDESIGLDLDQLVTRSRRTTSIVDFASNVLITTLDALTIAPLDNRSEVGTMGGKISAVDLSSLPGNFPQNSSRTLLNVDNTSLQRTSVQNGLVMRADE